MFFRPIRKTRWPPWPLIDWDIFDFSSKTAERNLTKLDRKQDINVLYQVCVYQSDWKNNVAAPASGWRVYQSDWKNNVAAPASGWRVYQSDWKNNVAAPASDWRVYQSDWKNNVAAPASDWLRHFVLFLWNHWTEFNEINRKEDLNFLYQVCVFRADQ